MSSNHCILPQLWDGHKLSNLKFSWSLLAWLIVGLLFFIWRAQNLDAFGLSNDEGAHLMWAKLATDGYPLYEETRAVQQPFFLGGIALAFHLLGPTIAAGRWAILANFVLLMGALSWLAYQTQGWWAAFTTLILVGVSPLVFSLSRLVMAEIPATAWATLSVALLLPFLTHGGKGWLVASGVAMGVSWMIKLLNPFAVVPIGMILLARCWTTDKGRRSALLRTGLGWGLSALGPLLVVLAVYDWAVLTDQLIAFRGDLRAAIPGSWAETWGHFRLFLESHWGFWLLGVGGIVTATVRHFATERDDSQVVFFYPLIWALWLLAGVAMLAWHTPLFAHHFVVLLPPLILLGAGFVADVVTLWRYPNLRFTAIVLTLFIPLAGLNLPSMIAANQETAAIVTGGRETEALKLLQAVSARNDFVMGDSQLLIFMAERRTPPPLGDVALVAIKAGRQTSARMIDLTEAYHAPAVVQWSLRLPWLPDYLAWVEANYLTRRVWDNDHLIYFAPRFPDGFIPPNRQNVTLGNVLALQGYEVDQSTLRAGDNLALKVYWQAQAPVSKDYTIFTQLLDSQGSLVASWDSQPLGGYFPTSQWPVDKIVMDVVELPLPPDLPAGDYTLITGAYLLETLERLTTPEGLDHINLTTVNLQK